MSFVLKHVDVAHPVGEAHLVDLGGKMIGMTADDFEEGASDLGISKKMVDKLAVIDLYTHPIDSLDYAESMIMIVPSFAVCMFAR